MPDDTAPIGSKVFQRLPQRRVVEHDAALVLDFDIHDEDRIGRMGSSDQVTITVSPAFKRLPLRVISSHRSFGRGIGNRRTGDHGEGSSEGGTGSFAVRSSPSMSACWCHHQTQPARRSSIHRRLHRSVGHDKLEAASRSLTGDARGNQVIGFIRHDGGDGCTRQAKAGGSAQVERGKRHLHADAIAATLRHHHGAGC